MIKIFKFLFKDYSVLTLVLLFILDFLVTYGLSLDYVFQHEIIFKANSFLCLIFFVAFYLVSYFCLDKFSLRIYKCALFPAFLLAVFHRIGLEFSITNHVNFLTFNFYVSLFSIFVIYTILIGLLLYNRTNIKHLICKFNIRIFVNFFDCKHSFIIVFFLIIFFWIPAYLAVYPGIYSYDAGPQVLQIYGNLGLNAHHPLAHTLFLDGCLGLGNLIFKSFNKGLVIYTLIQSFFMAFCFSSVINHMKKYKISYIFRAFALLFFALSPIVQIFCLMTTKDIIFGGFLLLILLDIIDFLLDTKNLIVKPSFIILFVIKCTLLCLFRNQGVILVFVIAIALTIWVFVKFGIKKNRIVVVFFCPLLIIFLIVSPIMNLCNVKPINAREALSVPIQQIARVYNLEKESITDADHQNINKYLSDEYLNQYNSWVSDGVKEGFNNDYFNKDKFTFFKVWFKLFIKHPSVYIDSFLFGSYGYFYVDDNPYLAQCIFYDGAWMDSEHNILGIERHPLFPSYDNYLRRVSFEQLLNKIPFVSVIHHQAFPFLLIVVLFSYLIYQKRSCLLIPLLFIFVFWLTLLAGPLISIRYAFPYMICVPTLLALFDYKSFSSYTQTQQLV